MDITAKPRHSNSFVRMSGIEISSRSVIILCHFPILFGPFSPIKMIQAKAVQNKSGEREAYNAE